MRIVVRTCKEGYVVRVEHVDGVAELQIRSGSITITQIQGSVNITIESTVGIAPIPGEISSHSTMSERDVNWSVVRTEVLELLKSRRAIDENSALTMDEIVEELQLSKEVYRECARAIALYGIHEFKRRLALVLGSLVRSGRVGKVKTKEGIKYYIKQSG